jgi:transcriptional regulator with XRE-family HTH domain
MGRHHSPTVNPALAAALVAARERAGKTQTQVAEALGVDVATIGNWEAARTEPKHSQLARLVLFYGVPPAAMFGSVVNG